MTYKIVENLRRKATWNDFDPATQDNFDEAAAHIEALAGCLTEAVAAIEAFEKNHGKAPTKRLHDAALRGRYALSNLRGDGQ
jgi:hypothetical protein